MTEKTMVRVWDPLVRIFHWGLVAVVAVAWLTADEWDDLHAISGYVVAPAFADDDEYGESGEHGEDEDGSEEIVENLHELLANGLLVLIALHVGGVILSSVRHRENLTRSMITGDKRAPEDGDVA